MQYGGVERQIFATAEEIAAEAARIISDEIASHDQLLLGLAGGSTPHATYTKLADASIDWGGVTTWMTDERWVPPADADANQAMIRSTLHTSGRIRFLAPNTRLELPEAAASRMTRAMRCLMNRRPSRAVTILGMGDDGHTASLFPGTSALTDTSVGYLANWVPRFDTWRLTASFGLLAAADVTLFLVAGEGKAEAVARIAAGEELPAGLVTAGERVVWLLDEGAASLL